MVEAKVKLNRFTVVYCAESLVNVEGETGNCQVISDESMPSIEKKKSDSPQKQPNLPLSSMETTEQFESFEPKVEQSSSSAIPPQGIAKSNIDPASEKRKREAQLPPNSSAFCAGKGDCDLF